MPRVKCPRCAMVQHVEDSPTARTWKCVACDRIVRRRRPRTLRGRGGYYLEGISAFGWVLLGLLAAWLGGVAVALVLPGTTRVLAFLGAGLVLVGNVWIGFVAYRDSHVFGMLCFFTCLFAYAYIFINPDETWRPAGLTGVGLLFLLSAAVLPQLGFPAVLPGNG